MALALCAASLPACAHNETSSVARGEYYAAGAPDYDEFFVHVYRYQTRTAEAIEHEKAVRAELARALGAKATSSSAELASVIKARGSDSSVEDALHKAAIASKELKDATSDGDAVDRLRVRAIDLDRQVDTAFWKEGQAKRSEVRKNLADAQKMLVLVGDKRRAVAEGAGTLLAACEPALHASAAPPSNPEATATSDEKPKKKAPRKRSGGSKPAAPASTPKAKPAAEPAPAPAPKAPAPKADFEP